MSDDPAVEAARRARMDGRSTHVQRVAAAREALKPIRELHSYEFIRMMNDSLERCRGCKDYWPCATARLVYPADELGVVS